MKVAVIGAGWAGCAAAVEATRRGHTVTLYEASRAPGGRARSVAASLQGKPVALDNGQHILIGAYRETLQLMADLGVDPQASLLRIPLTIRFPDGTGLALPRLAAPLDALVGILGARGWSWGEKLSLLKLAAGWRIGHFQCSPQQSVADVCKGLAPGVMATLIEPLCISALNTPPDRASGQVFLRVMKDALFAGTGSSNLLLPRADLGALLPEAALAWLRQQGGEVLLGARVRGVTPSLGPDGAWSVQAEHGDGAAPFDAVVLACTPQEAARLVQGSGPAGDTWRAQADALCHEAIATVYAHADGARLGAPMLALPADARWPAQFVFDRAQLGGPPGLLAFVVSASTGDSASLGAQVLAQADGQLGMANLQLVKTIVEKRATFACKPGLVRPAIQVAPGLLACGDYVDGPYPATLEGAVISGLAAARNLS